MAAAFLARDAMPPRIVVVAGESNGSLAPGAVAEGLRTAGRALDVQVGDVESSSMPEELPQVLLVELGPVDESSLTRLAPPLDPGPDLLLWTLPLAGAMSVRSRYVLGMWAWSLGAERVRCLVSGCEDPRALEVAVRSDLEMARCAGTCEVLEHTASDERGPLYLQILQSLLSSPPQQARARA